jgi:pseudaminic acid synthase
MSSYIEIAIDCIGPNRPIYIVAEMSANHNQDFDQAVRLGEAAREAGADAIKLQTYTPDTMTIDCNNEYFVSAMAPLGAGISITCMVRPILPGLATQVKGDRQGARNGSVLGAI